MSQDHHYLPQVYLRQWCGLTKLLRYRRVGPRAVLEGRRCSPRGIAYEPDLYTLPVGASANGLTGNDLEAKLAADVDTRLSSIIAAAAAFQGRVTDQTAERDILWLMRTFHARSPDCIQRVESGIDVLMREQAPTIERMIARANLSATRDELRSYADSRRPVATARAGIHAVIIDDLPDNLDWITGDVYALSATAFRVHLDAAGAGEFVTFDGPIVEWESNPDGVIATFAASPDTLILVTGHGRAPTPEECARAVLFHLLKPLAYRKWVICSTPLRGELLARVGSLRPTTR